MTHTFQAKHKSWCFIKKLNLLGFIYIFFNLYITHVPNTIIISGRNHDLLDNEAPL